MTLPLYAVTCTPLGRATGTDQVTRYVRLSGPVAAMRWAHARGEHALKWRRIG